MKPNWNGSYYQNWLRRKQHRHAEKVEDGEPERPVGDDVQTAHFEGCEFRVLNRPGPPGLPKTRLPLRPSAGRRSFRLPGHASSEGGESSSAHETDEEFGSFLQICQAVGERGGDTHDGQQGGGQGGQQGGGQSNDDDPKITGAGTVSSSGIGGKSSSRSPSEELALALTNRLYRLAGQPASTSSSPFELQLATMAAYVKGGPPYREGALRRLSGVKSLLLEASKTIQVSPRAELTTEMRDRFALLPLQLLACDRPRTESQRQIAVDRLRTAAKGKLTPDHHQAGKAGK